MEIKAANFNLEATLESGQVFRYEKSGKWYFLAVGDNIVRVRHSGGRLVWRSLKPFDPFGYFDLGFDPEPVLGKEKFLADAVRKYSGLKIMNQDFWECAVSFVCSSCSNIKRIKKNLNSLCLEYGEKICFEGYETCSFPGAESIVRNAGSLKKCGLGYRAGYVLGLAREVCSGFDFGSLRSKSYDDAKEALMRLDGVGPKVADCILLFSLGFRGAFPVDVWIERVMSRLYFGGRKTSLDRIAEYGRERFGENAGYAQQFLYHYSRNSDRFSGGD